MGSYVLLPDGFIMLLLCHLGAYLAVAPAAAAAAASHPRPISKVADLDSRSGLSRGPDGPVVGFRRFGIAR